MSAIEIQIRAGDRMVSDTGAVKWVDVETKTALVTAREIDEGAKKEAIRLVRELLRQMESK